MSDEPQPDLIDRETYVKRVVEEHLAVGFPPAVAQLIAETAITVADEVHTYVHQRFEEHLDPLTGQFNAVVPFAIVRVASNLMSSRFAHMAAQATEKTSEIINELDATVGPVPETSIN